MSDNKYENGNNEQRPQENAAQNNEPQRDRYQYPYGGYNAQNNYNGYSGYNPYQQGAGQNQQQQPRGEYRFNYGDYQQNNQQPKPRRSRGPMVFGIVLAVLLVAGIAGLSGYGVYSIINNGGLSTDEDASNTTDSSSFM